MQQLTESAFFAAPIHTRGITMKQLRHRVDVAERGGTYQEDFVIPAGITDNEDHT
jgi:hypothetical protein